MRIVVLFLMVIVVASCAGQPPPPPPAPVVAVPPAPPPAAPVEAPKPAPKKPAPKKPAAKQPPTPAPMIIGWTEHVLIGETEIPVKAKLDSGADTSSIDAEIIRTFKRKGKEYIIFRFQLNEELTETFETQIIRWVRIKGKKPGTYIRRPVVMLDFCLGERRIREEVNLADREHLTIPVLIGRNMLKHGNIVLDSTRQYTVEPSCPKKK